MTETSSVDQADANNAPITNPTAIQYFTEQGLPLPTQAQWDRVAGGVITHAAVGSPEHDALTMAALVAVLDPAHGLHPETVDGHRTR